MALVNTVQGKMEGFMRWNITGVNMARSTMDKLGNPSEEDYKGMVRPNNIYHFPVTSDDIDTTNKIFSRNIPSLKGKTVRIKPPSVVSDYIPIPR